MRPTTVLFFNPDSARPLSRELAALGAGAILVPPATIVAPPDPLSWARTLSELALFNWLVLPTAAAAEAVIEGIGAPPGLTIRVAAERAAGEVLRSEGRAPEVEASGLGDLLELLQGRIGRRQRALVPHAAVAGRRIGDRLQELGSEAVCRAAYDLRPVGAISLDNPTAAIVAGGTEAETLACWVQAGRIPNDLPVAALDPAAVDAAEDCGLVATLIPGLLGGGLLGPFLDETLS